MFILLTSATVRLLLAENRESLQQQRPWRVTFEFDFQITQLAARHINGGIDKTSASGIASIISPVVLTANQSWTNNSTGSLTASSTLDLGSNTLTVGGTGTSSLTGVISGSGNIVKCGPGRLTFNTSGANTYTGTTTINGGTLMMANNAASLGSGNVTLNGGSLEAYWGLSLTRALGAGSGQIQLTGGASGFGQNGGGQNLTVNFGNNAANEAVWGSASFNPSILAFHSPNSGAAASVTIANNMDLNGATRTVDVNGGTAGTAIGTVSGVIRSSSGIAGLIKNGAGTLVLTAANTFTGPVTISTGVLRLGNNSAGTLGNGNYAGNISIAGGSTLQLWSSSSQTLSGTISGAGALSKAYGGTLTLSGPNTYTGRTSFIPQNTTGFTVNISSFNSVNGGTPAMPGSSLGAPTSVANGTIDIGSSTQQAGVNLTYTGPGETTDRVINFGFSDTASQTLTASGSGLLKFTSAMTANTLTTQSGALILSGTGMGEITQPLPALPTTGLTKSGAGTWILSGSNAHTAPTSVTAGKLFINGDQSSATGNVSISTNATLGGTGTTGGNIAIAAGGKLEFNLDTAAANHNPLDLITGKGLTFSGASVLTITSPGGASPGIYTLITGGNNIGGVAPATLNLPANWTATLSISGNSLMLNVTSTGGPGPVHHFAISSIASPQTVGTVITGITLTAQDAANQTATSFTGTVTFGGTAGITGNSANFINGVLNGVSATPAATGANLTLTVDDGAGHTGSATFTVQSPYAAWAGGHLPADVSNPAGNNDGDSLTNLQEYAFGTDPTVSTSAPIAYTPGGNITTPGTPLPLNLAIGGGVDFRAVFGRRKNHVAAGLTYTVQFSADFTTWVTSTATPTLLTGENSASGIEAVSVPYPFFIPTASGHRKPTFFRVGVSSN